MNFVIGLMKVTAEFNIAVNKLKALCELREDKEVDTRGGIIFMNKSDYKEKMRTFQFR